MPDFGWIPPTPQKQLDNDRYLLRSIVDAPPPGTVEVTLTYPDYVSHYRQQNNGCTGFSASWMQSIYNRKKYDANWLYWQGRKEAGLPPNRDEGGYIWAVMDVLRKKGHRIAGTTTTLLDEGIVSYYWAKNIDDIRAAFSLGRPVVLGTFWFEGFMNPTIKSGRRWFPESGWGGILGGHAYTLFARSDSLSGVCLVNTWGPSYPPTWISDPVLLRLLSLQGEAAVAIDRGAAPPPPPPPTNTLSVSVKVNGVKYGPKDAPIP